MEAGSAVSEVGWQFKFPTSAAL